jgi:hypothetical protein
MLTSGSFLIANGAAWSLIAGRHLREHDAQRGDGGRQSTGRRKVTMASMSAVRPRNKVTVASLYWRHDEPGEVVTSMVRSFASGSAAGYLNFHADTPHHQQCGLAPVSPVHHTKPASARASAPRRPRPGRCYEAARRG